MPYGNSITSEKGGGNVRLRNSRDRFHAPGVTTIMTDVCHVTTLLTKLHERCGAPLQNIDFVFQVETQVGEKSRSVDFL